MSQPEPGFVDPDQSDRGIQPLNPASTRTESAVPEDATPVVLGEGSDTRAVEGKPSVSQLLGEVRSLRSRNQILRTERTSMAGRKYALEQVLESLKERLEYLAELCDKDPSEMGDALTGIRELVGQARAIASGKQALLEADLESERAGRLQQLQKLETQVSELNEQAIGFRAERDSLREHAGELEQERFELISQVSTLEAFRQEALQALEGTVQTEESHQTELEDALSRARDAEAAVGILKADVENQSMLAARQESELTAAQLRLGDLERELEQASISVETRERLERQQVTLADMKATLTEIKPVLDQLDQENRRLSRLLGEARKRGSVDVDELLARERLLRKLEQLTQDD